MTGMPMMWPTLEVQDVERSLSFYRDQLGLEQDLDLRDETGALFLASIEVDYSVIMLTRADPSTPQGPHRPGVRLTLLFDGSYNIDALLQRLLAGGTEVCSSIGKRPWGHRDFTVFDPDGYRVTIARPLEGSNR
jgi:uncharacterized glyoxalase superfamily protein PhnB